MTKVGAFEAKTHLSKLLGRVQAGETIAITRHGQEVAHLVPPPRDKRHRDIASAVAKWRKARKGLSLKGIKIRDLIEQGRK